MATCAVAAVILLNIANVKCEMKAKWVAGTGWWYSEAFVLLFFRQIFLFTFFLLFFPICSSSVSSLMSYWLGRPLNKRKHQKKGGGEFDVALLLLLLLLFIPARSVVIWEDPAMLLLFTTSLPFCFYLCFVSCYYLPVDPLCFL